jgi:hypothetical protein
MEKESYIMMDHIDEKEITTGNEANIPFHPLYF